MNTESISRALHVVGSTGKRLSRLESFSLFFDLDLALN